MISMNDFNSEPSEIRQAMLVAAERVLDSGWYVLGQEVTNFEKLWAKTCGIAYGVGVGNGLDAIEIALRALNIGQGDEVITTPMTAFATVLAIIRSGATPVLADIKPDTALLCIDSVQRCFSSHTKAIVLVHLYGQVRQMNAWQDLCETRGIALIEDCAQAHLAQWHGESAGAFGSAGAYSFYPTKNLGAMGDAGMLVTQHSQLAQKASELRNYGQSERYYHPELGLNSRLDELQAAILTARLPWLNIFTQRRREIASQYQQGLQNSKIQLLSQPEERLSHVYHLFVITCKIRFELQAHLKMHDIQSLIHYPIPIHHQAPCQELPCDPDGLRWAEEHAKNCLSLPCHPQMSDEDVADVIKVINSF